MKNSTLRYKITSMKKFTTYLIALLFLLLTLPGCELIDSIRGVDQGDAGDDLVTLSSLEFSEDYKYFTVGLKTRRNLDDTTKLVFYELNTRGDTLPERDAAKLIKIENIRVEQVAKVPDRVLVMVDMTLSEELIEMQRLAVRRLMHAYPNKTLYLAFMWGGSVSKSVPATEYILENHFIKRPPSKLLLRSILSKIDEMNGDKARYFTNVPQDTIWRNIPNALKRLIIFSDGQTYDGNRPIDSQHFILQRQIAQLTNKPDDVGGVMPVDYVNFSEIGSEPAERDLSLSLIVERCSGRYYDEFNINDLLSRVLCQPDEDYIADFHLTFENPNHKLYTGRERRLLLNYNVNDSLSYHDELHFEAGELYNPIIVGGTNNTRLIAEGFLVTLILVVLVYLILQLLVPYIRYQLFKRKYVAIYNGPQTIVEGGILDTTCYYCKDKFEIGDTVVAKCKHTLHEECWRENGYKCPDYGKRCPEGSHYYNQKNLWDLANAPFYMKWILCALFAAFLSWVVNMLLTDAYNSLPISIYSILGNFAESNVIINSIPTVVSEFFGMSLIFFVALYVSLFTGRGNWLKYRLPRLFVRTILCCLAVYVGCVLAAVIYCALGVYETAIYVDWIPWVTLAIGSVIVLSHGFNLDRMKLIKQTLILLVVVILSVYIWRYVEIVPANMILMKLYTNMLFNVGLTIILAIQLPQSRRYFLKVSGAIKQMDIALYKWFQSPTNRSEITIGKSVNCEICMSWDLSRSIAPQQLKIVRRAHRVYVVPLDSGVMMMGSKRELEIGKERRIYHGDGFVLGRTEFVYIELDL